ncbi:uncharacterized protein LOC132751166 isoform X2 [Ruditapes philippinarum]|uniref:uncharacterized protein LOC132751166 isoform X2 n=1 Tax=Ruditapes philippinarum TaxID=129788 RepID=UPI00295A8405|nr:uncharacterized protein LOC132751166 isoform X2 [Ruditapes philippinarum]
MPTTRQGAETPHRNVQLQGPQKVDARKAAQSNKKDAEIVKLTRRSQATPETSQNTPRRTRGSDVEPESVMEPASNERATRRNVVKASHAVGQTQSPSTRKSKRTATESPKVIITKKPRTDQEIKVPSATVVEDTSSDDVPKSKNEDQVTEVETKTDKGDLVEMGNDAHKNVDMEFKSSKTLKAEDAELKSSKLKKAGRGLKPEDADVISPRRSSRAVVPNSRFKDMVDLGKKKTVIKTESLKDVKDASTVKKPKVDYTSINVQQQAETNEITEEIITEETKIDQLAQMNLMDDTLVLPPGTTGASDLIPSEMEVSTEGSNSGIRVIKYPGAKVIRYPADTKDAASINPDIPEEVTDNMEEKEIQDEISDFTHSAEGASDNYDENDKSKHSNNHRQAGNVPEPQVIVIPGETCMSKIIIPKDPYRARLEQAFENKGGSMVIGPSTGKIRTKKLIVTPTHQHVLKKDPQRALKVAEHGEKIQSPETTLGKAVGKSTVTSVIYPWTQKPGISTGQTIHTPEKQQKSAVLPRVEDSNNNQGEENSVDLDGNITKTSNALPGESAAQVKANVPHVRVVYVKTKQKDPSEKVQGTHVGKKHGIQLHDGSGTRNIINNLRNNTQIPIEGRHTKVERSETFGKEINTDNISYIETTDQISSNKEDHRASENTQFVEGVEQVTSVPVEQNIANSLCQVIEYKHQPQTAIEYVLLDNKMVPIHKPLQVGGHHARVHSGRRAEIVHRATPGRVEPGGQKEQGDYFKKIPLSTAQSAISTVLSQIEDGQITSVPRNSHTKFTIPSRQQGSSDEELNETSSVMQQPRVLHGYIDYPVKTDSPTQIVEISTEAFNKEIYGEEVTLDTVTGELVQPSSASQIEIIPMQTVSFPELTSGNQSTQSVSLPEISAVNQSVKEVAGAQSVQVNVDQSMEENGQTVAEGSDNGGTIVYSGSEERHSGEVTVWTEGTPVVSSDSNVMMSTSEVHEDGILHIDGLDNSQIPENATVTVEKLASGGEIVIMQIKEAAVSKTLEKMKTSRTSINDHLVKSIGSKAPSVIRASVVGKSLPQPSKKYPYNVRINPSVMKLPEVKVTPVRAYEKSEIQGSEKSESSVTVVSKTTGTNTEDNEADMDDDEEEEEGITLEEIGRKKDAPYQEYIVVRLPEGSEVKQLQPRPKKEKTPLGEEVTMDTDGMYFCVDCGHKTENRGNWFKHRRKHLGIRPHACHKCSYRAATSSNLKRHMQIHDDVRNFLCVYCNMLFRQKIHLERHLKYKHEEKNVQCPLCDYVCSSEDPDLKNHIKRRHMPQEGALNAFTCDVCGLMTVSKKDLKQHKKFHKNGPELKLFCEHCSFVTDCVSRLRRHMLIHTKERPFQCGLCTYRATQKEHVLRHMRSQHGVEVERNQRRSLLEKNYNNPQEILIAGMEQSSSTATTSASKESTSEADIGPFEKSDYSSTDKIFACNYCSMKFSKLINLYKHLYAQHKQVMPDEGPNDFQCVVCDFHTNSKKNLLVHMRKHNMQDHSPPTHVYSCVLCRYINPRRRNLFQHMKKKHGIEIIMKDDGLNCYVTLDNAAAQVQGQSVKSSVMALSDIVTTQTMDDAAQMEFMTGSGEDTAPFHAEKITIDNIMADEMESYVVSDSSHEHSMVSPQVSISTVLHASVQEHEAAEAIEGLQALAEQAGILETQNVDNDMTSEIVSSAIEIVSTHEMNEAEVLNSSETIIRDEGTLEEVSAEGNEGFEVSTEQLSQLATGDFVEINGEVYKVEIAPEGS